MEIKLSLPFSFRGYTNLQDFSVFFCAEDFINKREESLDYEVLRPHSLEQSPGKNGGSAYVHVPGVFPTLDVDLLNRPPATSPQKSPWKQRYRNLRRVENAVNEVRWCFFLILYFKRRIA